MFVVGRTETSSKEGMTKDDLISMVIHGFRVTALIEMSLNIRVARTIANIVGNNTKGRISKRESQKNKARQFFRKTNISYVHVSGGKKYVPFCLITNKMVNFVTIVNGSIVAN